MIYSTRRFVVCLSVCHFVLVFFSPFSIAITSLGEERANLRLRAAVCDCGTPWTFLLPFLIRMFASMKSRSSSILGYLGSKTRSPGQIKGKTC